jgi:hypothetical protein
MNSSAPLAPAHHGSESSIVAIRRFLITRDWAQFTTVIQRDMSLTTAKTIAITLFAEILWKAFSDP